MTARSPRPRRRTTQSLLAAAAAATGLVALGSPPADAGLTVDLRVTSTTGTASIIDAGKGFVGAPGDTLTIGVFARVSGTNGVHDETVQSFYGSFTSPGSLHLDASGMTLLNGFDGTSSQLGSVQDLDSDGDLDIGSTGSISVGKFFARANSPLAASVAVDPNTGEVQVASFTLTVGAGTLPYSINFVPRTNATGGNLNVAAIWFQDNDGVLYNPTAGSFTAGAPIAETIIPEPTTLGLLALSSVRLLARRNRTR